MIFVSNDLAQKEKFENKKELAKIKTILKAIEVDFIESEDSYDKDFVLKIEKSRKEIFLKKVDDALYKAKSSGRNCVEYK